MNFSTETNQNGTRENIESPHQIPKEKPVDLESFFNVFIPNLSQDHPELAQTIASERLPDMINNMIVLWKEFQESLKDGGALQNAPAENRTIVESILSQEQPDQEFIDATISALNEFQYISNKEIDEYMGEFALEIAELLQADPEQIIVFETDLTENASETHFARMVKDKLPAELQNRVLLVIDIFAAEKKLLADQHRILCYRFDDASNSGSQVISSSKSFISEFQDIGKPIDIRVKLIATGNRNIKDYVRARVEKTREGNNNSDNTGYTIDVSYKQLNERIVIEYKGQTVSWGTSIIFGHKIQDNLPELFLSLSPSHRRDKPHLFEMDEDIIPDYKK